MSPPWKNCPDCDYLKERYGEHNLNECEFCGHLYHGEECSCGGPNCQ